jgi:hypothetical protein
VHASPASMWINSWRIFYHGLSYTSLHSRHCRPRGSEFWNFRSSFFILLELLQPRRPGSHASVHHMRPHQFSSRRLGLGGGFVRGGSGQSDAYSLAPLAPHFARSSCRWHCPTRLENPTAAFAHGQGVLLWTRERAERPGWSFECFLCLSREPHCSKHTHCFKIVAQICSNGSRAEHTTLRTLLYPTRGRRHCNKKRKHPCRTSSSAQGSVSASHYFQREYGEAETRHQPRVRCMLISRNRPVRAGFFFSV